MPAHTGDEVSCTWPWLYSTVALLNVWIDCGLLAARRHLIKTRHWVIQHGLAYNEALVATLLDHEQ